MKDEVKDITIRTFSERLREVILRLGVSKKDFAKAGGVTPQALSGYLNGSRKPDHETIAKWIREFNLNANYLLIYRGTMFRSDTDNMHPMDLEAPGAEKNPPRAAAIEMALGPVAQRVDGIERAAKGTPLIDLIPFVVTNLRAWYGQEAKRLGVDAREPGAAVYAQEGSGQRRTRILDDKERDERLAKLERMIDGDACGIDQDPSTGTIQLMTLGRDRPPEKKQPNKRSRD